METREEALDAAKQPESQELNPVAAPELPAAEALPEITEPSESPEHTESTETPGLTEAQPEPASKEEVLEILARLAAEETAEISREEIARLKQQFYAFRKAELDQELADFLAEGKEAAAFMPALDEAEERFKELMNAVKDRKAAITAALEEERKHNFERKQALIGELQQLAADTDNVNRAFPRVKEIQAEFKLIGEVPATEATDQWKLYQAAVEQFYDQLKVNKDLRDYDFKKNLELKTLLD